MESKDITEAIERGIENKLGDFFVQRQQHYDDHIKTQRLGHDDIDFLIASREFVTSIKDAFWKTAIKIAVVAFFGMVTGGVYFYFKYHGK